MSSGSPRPARLAPEARPPGPSISSSREEEYNFALPRGITMDDFEEEVKRLKEMLQTVRDLRKIMEAFKYDPQTDTLTIPAPDSGPVENLHSLPYHEVQEWIARHESKTLH